MSYILEALQKSERERNLGKVNTLATLHHEQRSANPAIWRALALVAMLLALGAGSWVWWGTQPRPATVAATERPGSSPPAASGGGATAMPSPGAATQVAAPEPAAAHESSADPVPPPELDELDAALREKLAGLALNVLSYSDTPAKRFVMIDQRIIREGQSLRNGVKIEHITPDGAVMRYGDQEFLVRP